MTFVFSLQTKYYINYIDKSIYTVNAIQTNIIFNENKSYIFENKGLKVIKCHKFRFEIIPDKFKKLFLNNLYCFNSDINLKSDFMEK